MPAPDLTPQVPGEQPSTVIPPVDKVHTNDALDALVAGNVQQVIGALAGLGDEDLAALRVLEEGGRKRVGVLRAIDAQVTLRNPPTENDPVLEPVPTAAVPKKFDHAVLTDKGWLVPEPHQRTTPPPVKG